MGIGVSTYTALEEAGRQASTHEALVECVICVERARKVPGVDRDVNDAVLEKLPTPERTPRVVNNPLHGTGLLKRGVERRARARPLLDRVAAHHRGAFFFLSVAANEVFSTSAAKEIGIAEVRADYVVHKLPHVPLGARGWLCPIIGTQELEPSLEPQARHRQEFEVSFDRVGA